MPGSCGPRGGEGASRIRDHKRRNVEFSYVYYPPAVSNTFAAVAVWVTTALVVDISSSSW